MNRLFSINATILTLFLLLAPIFAQSFETNSQFAVLMDYHSGKIIYSKNSASKMAPSSMSKLMTLYIVFSELKSGKLQLTHMIPISDKAWRVEGSKMFVEVNTKVSVSDLLRGVVVQSGNDASIALAEYLAGSEAAFADRMNLEAKRLGLEDSNFVNSTGLPNPNHYMSANDLALLSKHIISEFPEYYPIFSEKEFTFNNITQPNRNYDINTHGIDGLKTGHTSTAGYGIVVSALNTGRRLIAVVNGLHTESARLEEAKALLAYGFSNFQHIDIAVANKRIGTIPVLYGMSAEVGLVSKEPIKLLIPHSMKADQIKVTLRHQNYALSPIIKDAKLAELVVTTTDGQETAFPLFAEESVDEVGTLKHLYYNMIYKFYM